LKHTGPEPRNTGANIRYRIEVQLFRDDHDKPEIFALLDYDDESDPPHPLPAVGDFVGFGEVVGRFPKHVGKVTHLTYTYNLEVGICFIIINAERVAVPSLN